MMKTIHWGFPSYGSACQGFGLGVDGLGFNTNNNNKDTDIEKLSS